MSVDQKTPVPPQSVVVKLQGYASDGPGYCGNVLMAIVDNKLVQQLFYDKALFDRMKAHGMQGAILEQAICIDGSDGRCVSTSMIALPGDAVVLLSPAADEGFERARQLLLSDMKEMGEESSGWAEYLLQCDPDLNDVEPSRLVLLQFQGGGEGYLLLGGEPCYFLLKTPAAIYSGELEKDAGVNAQADVLCHIQNGKFIYSSES